MLFPKMFPLKLVKVKLNLFVPNCLWGLSSFYQNLDHVLVRFAGLKSCKVSPSGCLRKGIVRLHLSGKRKPSLGTLYSPSASFIEMEHCQVLRGPCFLPPHSHNHSSPNTLTLSSLFPFVVLLPIQPTHFLPVGCNSDSWERLWLVQLIAVSLIGCSFALPTC